MFVVNEELLRFEREYNLTSIVNKMTGVKAFVVSDTPDENTFQFNICGYCFTIQQFRPLLDRLLSSSDEYLNVEVAFQGDRLYSTSGEFINTSMIVEGVHDFPHNYLTSNVSSFTINNNYLDNNVVTNDGYCIREYKDGYTTYVFTIVQKVVTGDKTVLRVPPNSMIGSSDALIGFEFASSVDGIIDDGEL